MFPNGFPGAGGVPEDGGGRGGAGAPQPGRAPQGGGKAGVVLPERCAGAGEGEAAPEEVPGALINPRPSTLSPKP